ncbi:CAAX amino terminal protease family [Sphaerochaeta pleomorpha str. Grapes]|uniref:CAAX amino terminal protease family n=1 Tax=Sphaerochaeta pleomorpha (strain ATCC BAA-1885 / DSM 22778 / Grapes) TaxID=158190 RepID=G8QUV3_SPHPG|nr:CPBP family intramembrane glutamic endopeptidase [Sphaerochaeta pleomorpha]AEV28129.1 CAAX amino terminal protease family [Sphaerochaeta pleomorpha str. Grapes]
MIEENTLEIEQHSVLKSLVLHLLPGMLIGMFYFAFYARFAKHGYPSIMALAVAVPVVLVPVELGYLLVQGYKKNKKLSLKQVISYLQPIKTWEYFVWIPILFGIIGIIFTQMKPVDQFMQSHVFSWMPTMQSGLEGGYAKPILIRTYLMVIVFVVCIGPIVEELYFRGYLLPRMKYAGKFAPLLHSFLFALYHVFTPWMILTRTIGLLPLIYTVKKKNLYVGIGLHILMNSVDMLTGVLFITKMV